MTPGSHRGRPRVLPTACVLSPTSLEMITMLAAQRTTCWSSDLSTACWRETTSARRKIFFPGRSVQKRGGRDSSAIPTKRPGRLSHLARPLRAHGPCHCALSRCPKKVDQAGRQGLVAIIWLFFSRYWHLEGRREPSQRLVKPMDFSRTHVTSHPESAREQQGKRARTKFSDGR